MNFNWVYIIIPLVLFLIKPKKLNVLLLLYWFAVCVLSYDNVSDYASYLKEFEHLSLYGFIDTINKERELGWYFLLSLFRFTKYGFVIVHALILTLVVYAFFKFTPHKNILSFSILLYFLFNLTFIHDNIVRQDVSIVCGSFSFNLIINTEKWNVKKISTIAIITVIAMLFHFSAFILIPFYFIIKRMSRIIVDFKVAVIIVVFLAILFGFDAIQYFLRELSLLLKLTGNDYFEYYSTVLLMEYESTISVKLLMLYGVVFCFPLFYFQVVSKERYNTDPMVRLCVNLSWIVMVWRFFFSKLGSDMFVRPIDYLLWFALWGYAYMLEDIWRKKKTFISCSIFAFFMLTILFEQYNFNKFYYSDNKYMTVLTKECAEIRTYNRNWGFGEYRNR